MHEYDTVVSPMQKENALTVVWYNHLYELPWQASAIWKYDTSSGGKLTPTILGVDGKPIKIVVYGGPGEDNRFFAFSGFSPAEWRQPHLDFYFVPASA